MIIRLSRVVGGGWRMTELPPVRRPPPASRLTRRRTAPPTREPPPSSPAMMRAAPDSRASLVRRTATPRDTTGAESITTTIASAGFLDGANPMNDAK